MRGCFPRKKPDVAILRSPKSGHPDSRSLLRLSEMLRESKLVDSTARRDALLEVYDRLTDVSADTPAERAVYVNLVLLNQTYAAVKGMNDKSPSNRSWFLDKLGRMVAHASSSEHLLAPLRKKLAASVPAAIARQGLRVREARLVEARGPYACVKLDLSGGDLNSLLKNVEGKDFAEDFGLMVRLMQRCGLGSGVEEIERKWADRALCLMAERLTETLGTELFREKNILVDCVVLQSEFQAEFGAELLSLLDLVAPEGSSRDGELERKFEFKSSSSSLKEELTAVSRMRESLEESCSELRQLDPDNSLEEDRVSLLFVDARSDDCCEEVLQSDEESAVNSALQRALSQDQRIDESRRREALLTLKARIEQQISRAHQIPNYPVQKDLPTDLRVAPSLLPEDAIYLNLVLLNKEALVGRTLTEKLVPPGSSHRAWVTDKLGRMCAHAIKDSKIAERIALQVVSSLPAKIETGGVGVEDVRIVYLRGAYVVLKLKVDDSRTDLRKLLTGSSGAEYAEKFVQLEQLLVALDMQEKVGNLREQVREKVRVGTCKKLNASLPEALWEKGVAVNCLCLRSKFQAEGWSEILRKIGEDQ